MALHSDTDLYRAIAEFQKFVARRAPHLPRDLKRLYGERLVDESLNMLVTMRHANIARDRARLARAVMRRDVAVDQRLMKAYP